jgi:hypothetical protein
MGGIFTKMCGAFFSRVSFGGSKPSSGYLYSHAKMSLGLIGSPERLINVPPLSRFATKIEPFLCAIITNLYR